jgi:hypothetical protein
MLSLIESKMILLALVYFLLYAALAVFVVGSSISLVVRIRAVKQTIVSFKFKEYNN